VILLCNTTSHSPQPFTLHFHIRTDAAILKRLPRQPPKRPIKATASPESGVYNLSENEAASPESDAWDIPNIGSASPESGASRPSETKQYNHRERSARQRRDQSSDECRSTKNLPVDPFLIFPIQKVKGPGRRIVATTSTIQLGQFIRVQPSRQPNIALSPATANLDNFYATLPGLSANSATLFQYTPAGVRTVHTLKSPIYKDRDFRLVDVALEIAKHSNLLKTRAWRIWVRDVNDPNKTHG